MKISIKDVDYLCKLSKLKFNDEQKTQIEQYLNGVLEQVDIIKSIDTKGESFDLSFVVNSMRDDVVNQEIPVEELIKGAPSKYETALLVPRVVE